ncbi:MAG: GNAT family N-acetyltransferase [Bacteroidetes bacterium]|nr:MAG: GNAT family N-acetyltransferase [Bacteroidota bacterium]
MNILVTERLILRRFTLSDTAFIIELLNTEGWIKYIGEKNVRTTDQARAYLENGPLKSYRNNGFGLALVELKANHVPIGMCGLISRDYLDHLDVGFAFLPNHTGHGYAFEIVTKTIEHVFSELEQEQIFAITLPQNYSSIKLLAKVGFGYNKNFITPDTNEELCLYSIKREEFGKWNVLGSTSR